MNLPKFPHSAMFVGVTACGKTEFLLKLLETIYKNHFEFIVILCPTILDNKTYLSRKWIFDDKNVFIVCDLKGNNKKRSHTQLDSRKQVIAFQDRVMTINIKEAQHPLK